MILNNCIEGGGEKTIIFGINPMRPPYAYIEREELKGFSIDLQNLIAEKLLMKANTLQMNFNVAFEKLNDGIIDIIVDVVSTKERKKYFDFSTEYNLQSFVILQNKADPNIDLKKLVGKRISVTLGTAQEVWLKQNIDNKDNIISVNHEIHAIQQLIVKNISGVFLDKFTATHIIEKNDKLKYIEIKEAKMPICIAVKKIQYCCHKLIKQLMN